MSGYIGRSDVFSESSNIGNGTPSKGPKPAQAEVPLDRAFSATPAISSATSPGGAPGSRAGGPGPSAGPAGADSLSEAEVSRLRADAELEASVLDALTDVALTACAQTSRELRLRLIRVLDRGMIRPRHLNLPEGVTGAPFSHLCLRKLYVLCSRGAQSQVPCLLEVAQLALPVLLTRCDTLLRAYVRQQREQTGVTAGQPSIQEDGQQTAPCVPASQQHDVLQEQYQDRYELDEVMCVLEVMATMTLTAPVVDSALLSYPTLQAVVAVNRQRREQAGAKSRERTHLLLLYGALCECASLQESRIRDMVRDVLQMSGVEMGLPMGLEAS